jgi:hypothetical protein
MKTPVSQNGKIELGPSSLALSDFSWKFAFPDLLLGKLKIFTSHSSLERRLRRFDYFPVLLNNTSTYPLKMERTHV